MSYIAIILNSCFHLELQNYLYKVSKQESDKIIKEYNINYIILYDKGNNSCNFICIYGHRSCKESSGGMGWSNPYRNSSACPGS